MHRVYVLVYVCANVIRTPVIVRSSSRAVIIPPALELDPSPALHLIRLLAVKTLQRCVQYII
jgi:hypothetical protein